MCTVHFASSRDENDYVLLTHTGPMADSTMVVVQPILIRLTSSSIGHTTSQCSDQSICPDLRLWVRDGVS